MKFTDLFRFKKPEPTDTYSIEHQNENWDIVEQEMTNIKNEHLPLDGGTLTGNSIYFADGYGRVHSDQNVTQIEHFDTKKDNNNRRQFIVNGSNKTGKDTIVLSEWKNGVQKLYSIYGDHYIPTADKFEAITYGANRITIQENDDLNNYLECGCYACANYGTAQSLKNSPVDDAFTMDILSGTGKNDKITTDIYSYIIQSIRTITGEQYYRQVYSRPNEKDIIYENWKKIITNNDMVIIEGTETVTISEDVAIGTIIVPYPDGFTKDNCTILNVMGKNLGYNNLDEYDYYCQIGYDVFVQLKDEGTSIQFMYEPGTHTVQYKLSLYKYK